MTDGYRHQVGPVRIEINGQLQDGALYLGEQVLPPVAKTCRHAHFCVATPAFGDVACHLSLLGERIALELKVSRREYCAPLEQCFASLRTGLTAQGYQIDRIAVEQSDAPRAECVHAMAHAHLLATEGLNQWI